MKLQRGFGRRFRVKIAMTKDGVAIISQNFVTDKFDTTCNHSGGRLSDQVHVFTTGVRLQRKHITSLWTGTIQSSIKNCSNALKLNRTSLYSEKRFNETLTFHIMFHHSASWKENLVDWCRKINQDRNYSCTEEKIKLCSKITNLWRYIFIYCEILFERKRTYHRIFVDLWTWD